MLRKRALYASPVGESGKARLASIISRFGHDQADFLVLQYDDTQFVEPEFSPCLFARTPGGFYQNVVRHVTPVRCAGYDYIVVWSDDLEIDDQFSFSNFLAIMERNRLEVAQPALTSRSKVGHEITRQTNQRIGRLTDFVETGYHIFQRDAWTKFWNMLEKEKRYNAFWAWGWDLIARAYCGYERMAIIDCETVTHLNMRSPGEPDAWAAMERLFEALPTIPRSQKVVLGELV